MFARARRIVAMFAIAALGASCEFGKVTVPKTEATIVVHAVLNTSATNQVVLLERSLNGAVTIPDTVFDPADPIVSAGGVPITGANIEISDSSGRVSHGIEDRVGTGSASRGTGVYRVPISGSTLVSGMRYQLHVFTPEGDEATAFARVPRADVRSTGALTRTFNRDHDALNVEWTRATSTRTYAVRVESPFGPFFLFTDSTRIHLDGDLRNLFAGDLQHVFIPGFRQDVLVAAVDSNFYDYYRTNNDPFTGSGIINRITGGIGLFGAIVPLTSGTISVIADRGDPLEGRYRFITSRSTGLTPFTSDMTVYVESKPAHEGLATALSGRYINATGELGGLLGEERDGVITLSLLNNQLSGSKLDVFTGVLRADTLVGSFERGAGAISYFLRTP